MRSSRLVVKKIGPALGKFAYLVAVSVLSAIAGVLVASKMGLIVSRSDYQSVVSSLVKLRDECSQLLIGNVLLVALVENPPPGSRVVVESGLLGIVSVGGGQPGGRRHGFWSFSLVPPPTTETWPEVSRAIREAITNNASASGLLGHQFGFKLEDVDWKSGDSGNPNEKITIEFIYYLSRKDLTPPEPKVASILNELYSLMSRDGSSAAAKASEP